MKMSQLQGPLAVANNVDMAFEHRRPVDCSMDIGRAGHRYSLFYCPLAMNLPAGNCNLARNLYTAA